MSTEAPGMGRAEGRAATDREAWERHPGIHGIAGFLLHVHDSFRASSAALVRLVEAPPDVSTVARLRRVFLPLAHTLHYHHHAEEERLFPLVRARTGTHPDALVDDHGALTAHLDEVSAAVRAQDLDRLAARVPVLDAALRAHLDREEAIAIPVLLEISAAEAARLLHGG